MPVTRATAAGRAYLDLQNRARRERRSTQELLTFYVLERFLARVAASAYRREFILKGGLLLAVLDARRPTQDADLLALTSAEPGPHSQQPPSPRYAVHPAVNEVRH